MLLVLFSRNSWAPSPYGCSRLGLFEALVAIPLFLGLPLAVLNFLRFWNEHCMFSGAQHPFPPSLFRGPSPSVFLQGTLSFRPELFNWEEVSAATLSTSRSGSLILCPSVDLKSSKSRIHKKFHFQEKSCIFLAVYLLVFATSKHCECSRYFSDAKFRNQSIVRRIDTS